MKNGLRNLKTMLLNNDMEFVCTAYGKVTTIKIDDASNVRTVIEDVIVPMLLVLGYSPVSIDKFIHEEE